VSLVKPLLVGISGRSGSGKTFTTTKLLDYFPKSDISFISQDQYYLPLEKQPRDMAGVENFDDPEGIDFESLFTDIKALSTGRSVSRREYSFNNPYIKPKILKITPAPILLVEGLFIFYFYKIATMLDLKIFIDSNEELSLKRRITRDWDERALTENKVRYQWENHVKPAFDKFLLPYKTGSDIVVNNDDEPDLSPLIELINEKRTQVRNRHR